MKKTALTLISCTAAVTLFTGCGSAAVTRGEYPAVTSEDIEEDIKEGPEEDADLQDTNEEKIFIERPDPTIYVTFGEFQDRMGYSFFIPDGAQDIYYMIDTDSDIGTMVFTLNGVNWTAKKLKSDTYIRLDNTYIDDNDTEISCDFKDDPALKVYGAEPEVNGYLLRYSEDWSDYVYSANWFLENEGYSISLSCHADAPIDSMPVEVFQ